MAQNTSRLSDLDDTVGIVQFLQRPVRLEHFKLFPGDGTKPLSEIVTQEPQQPVKSYGLPYAVLEKGGKLAKTLNHQFFKADIHVKLTLNTNPFVAGRFYLTYSPYEDKIVRSRQQNWASRAGVTAYPGVEIDAQLDNTVEIVIPYASYKEAYVLTVEPENFVFLHLYAITPVMGNADSKGPIDFTIFAWFENITLNMPTLKTIDLPEKPARPIVSSISAIDKERVRMAREIEKLKKTQPQIYNYIMTSLKMENKMVSLQVQAEAQGGLISEIASGVGQVADAVAGTGIPVVDEIASTVSWVANIAKSIASIFGWSRPNSEVSVMAVQNLPGKFYAHVKAEDQSVALALSNENELEKPLAVFPSRVDEMDLAYVCSNPAIKAIFDWKVTTNATEDSTTMPIGLLPVGIGCFTAQVSGTGGVSTTTSSEVFPVSAKSYDALKGSDPVCMLGINGRLNSVRDKYIDRNVFGTSVQQNFNSEYGTCGKNAFCAAPSAFLKATGSLNNIILDTAPCEYVSQLFQYWRATICFKISIVKTAFHTGRLEVFFDPGDYYNDGDIKVTPTLAKYRDVDTANNYKYIMDLTNDSEVTIRIPFVSEKLALKTHGLNTGLRTPSPQDVMDSIIGSLIIRPVTNLMCPDTVSQTVKVVVWKWAEDVALFGPINAGNSDFSIYGVNAKPDPKQISFADIPKDVIAKLSYTPTATVMEEKSVVLQINIGNVANGNVITFFDTTAIETRNMEAAKQISGERLVSLRPLLRAFRNWTQFKGKSILLDVQEESEKIDYLSFLSYMYRFFRGGMRYKLISTDAGTITSWIHPGKTRVTTQAPSHMTFNNLNPMHEISVPYYSQYRKLPISSADNLLSVTAECNSEQNVTVLRAGNDDLTYGWLMGTPQLMSGDSSVTWTSYSKEKDGTIEAPASDGQVYKYISPNQSCSAKLVAPEASNSLNPYANYATSRVRREIDEESLGVDTPDSWSIKNANLQNDDERTRAWNDTFPVDSRR